MRRTIPVITAIRKQSNIPISIDTIKAAVAEAALTAGADIINDVSALGDPQMAPLAARHKCPIILMHNRGNPRDIEQDSKIGGEYKAAAYKDVVEDVKRELSERAEAALKARDRERKHYSRPGARFRQIGRTKSRADPLSVARIKVNSDFR